VPLTSDPHAWLRPIYSRLRSDHTFPLFAPSHQFNLLREAAEEISPSKVALMREYNATTQAALLDHLASVYRDQPSPTRETELWRVRKGDRDLSCVAVYLPSGIDLRLMEGADFRRTVLVKDAAALPAQAEEWLTALQAHEWNKT